VTRGDQEIDEVKSQKNQVKYVDSKFRKEQFTMA